MKDSLYDLSNLNILYKCAVKVVGELNADNKDEELEGIKTVMELYRTGKITAAQATTSLLDRSYAEEPIQVNDYGNEGGQK